MPVKYSLGVRRPILSPEVLDDKVKDLTKTQVRMVYGQNGIPPDRRESVLEQRLKKRKRIQTAQKLKEMNEIYEIKFSQDQSLLM